MSPTYTRREMLRLTGRAALVGAVGARLSHAAAPAVQTSGAIVGEPTAAQVGDRMLSNGGNAVDAIVAAALTAAVVSPHNCGIGGYGGHMVIVMARGSKAVAIDFNTAAPAAAHGEMFPLDARGAVTGQINDHGWLASGVPGTLAGLQLALDRHGTKSFRECVAPAVKLAKDGFQVTPAIAAGVRGTAALLRQDPGSTRLLLPDGRLLKEGDWFRNPDLAALLETLAARNSVDAFYRGDIAQHIAAAFQKNGGLVVAADMVAYRARALRPLELSWRGFSIRTAPLTAGGLTVIQALTTIKALQWENIPAGPVRSQAQVEALRAAWHDRLTLLGDPEKAKVPVARLLSQDYAHETARQIQAAVKARRPLEFRTEYRPHVGTVHLSCVDAHGNMAALTLTHGNAFGARVTVEGLGLTLGHGMSRFDPRPDHPNAPGPGKRPLHNMCPTVVLRDGRPVLALGGAGGRKIPSAVFNVLLHFVGLGATMKTAIAEPRVHTEGNLDLTAERKWPEAEIESFTAIGFKIQQGSCAVASAVALEPKTGAIHAAAR